MVAPVQVAADDGSRSATAVMISPTAAKLRTIMSLVQAPVADPFAESTPAASPAGTQGAAAAPASAPIAWKRVYTSDEVRAARSGLGEMIAGGVMVGPAPALLIGLGFLVRNVEVGPFEGDGPSSAPFKGVIVFMLAGISFAAGIALLIVGHQRYSAWQRWKQSVAILPTASRTSTGTWTPGLALRF